jgi:hypothetical protein
MEYLMADSNKSKALGKMNVSVFNKYDALRHFEL